MSSVPHQHILFPFISANKLIIFSSVQILAPDTLKLKTASQTKKLYHTYHFLQMTSMYTGFLDLDMIMKKTFKGQELLSSQLCLVGITLENIPLKMLIHEKTYL
jgi:hypothetical protein